MRLNICIVVCLRFFFFICFFFFFVICFFQAEDGIRDLVRSRGLGDVYKRQPQGCVGPGCVGPANAWCWTPVG